MHPKFIRSKTDPKGIYPSGQALDAVTDASATSTSLQTMLPAQQQGMQSGTLTGGDTQLTILPNSPPPPMVLTTGPNVPPGSVSPANTPGSNTPGSNAPPTVQIVGTTATPGGTPAAAPPSTPAANTPGANAPYEFGSPEFEKAQHQRKLYQRRAMVIGAVLAAILFAVYFFAKRSSKSV